VLRRGRASLTQSVGERAAQTSRQGIIAGASQLTLGDNASIDDSVLLAYPASRSIANRLLVIGPHARILSGSVIYQGTTIGAHLTTGHNIVIREENVIGDNFSIWSNSIVDYGCRIGNRVKIHCNCYVAQFTTIEDDVFLAPGVTIANDIHPGCEQSMQCMRGPTIKRGAQIGINVTLLPFITIGERALIGSGSVVTRDVPPEAVVAGNPARVLKNIHDLRCVTGVRECPYPGGVVKDGRT
jgi:acetyltransferase-like isoleucine patch superfamily enzyme